MKIPTPDDLADTEPLAPEVPSTPGRDISRSASRYYVAIGVLAAVVALGIVGAAWLSSASPEEALATTPPSATTGH